jgi:MFS family permease
MERPRLVTTQFMLLVGGHFTQGLGWSTMLLLPLYLAHIGASREQIGDIVAAAAIGGLLFRPLVSWGLDAIGRRATLMAGTVLLSAGAALIGLVESIGPIIYMQRIVWGVGVAMLFSGYFTAASDIIPISRRTEGIALFGVSGLVPLVVNPFVSDLGFEGAELRAFYPIVGAVILCSFFFLVPLREPARERSVTPVRLPDVGRALTARPLLPVWLATVIFASMVATFMAFATVAAASAGVARPALIWLAYAAGACAVRLFGGRLPDRIGPSNLVAPALALYALAAITMAHGASAAEFFFAGGLAGLGHGYCFPVLASQVVSRSPAHLRGTALASYTGIWEASGLILTPLFGRVAHAYDDATMFSARAVLSVVLLTVWAGVEHLLGGGSGALRLDPAQAPAQSAPAPVVPRISRR